jgi:Flp pilus assembly protein TadG
VTGALRRLLRDQGGSALAEFALVAPVMLLMMIGSAEVVQAVEAHRRVTHVASAIADIVAQERTTDDGKLKDVFVAGTLLMAPLPAGQLGQRIASFSADANGVVTMDWVANRGAYVGSEPLALPPAYTLKAEQGVIVADVSYGYAPLIQWVLPDSILMQKRMYLRPRLADRVVKTDAAP